MTEEKRHGMDEFSTRLTRVEERSKSMQAELTEFKSEFHDHHVTDRQDRKDIMLEQKAIRSTMNEMNQKLSKFDGWKGGVLFAVALLGGLLALAFKKLFGG